MAISNVFGITLVISLLITVPAGVKSVGVCYGMIGNNLPSPTQVISLFKSHNIKSTRLYSPNQGALQALKGSNINLILDVPDPNLQSIAQSPSTANSWVQTYVVPYYPSVSFRYINVGNEAIPGDLAQYVLPAMQNIWNALYAAGLENQIKVSTAVSTGVLGASYPPSDGAFTSDAQSALNPIVQFLLSKGSPLLVNVYPYFSYAGNPSQISLDYALFRSSGTLVQDGQYGYQNLFDAIVDAVYASLEKVGGSNVGIVVSESGWPSAGGFSASVSNAQTYNQNLINHVGNGTPRRPGTALETYVFAMFNENGKSSVLEQNFGIFYPDQSPVYQLSFP